jgi:hypothetical protein
VSYYGYDEERIPQSQLSERRVKSARKQHRCSGCFRSIEIGSSYVREFWLVDGEPTSITRHHGCFTY